jgi:hypothetical protein
VKESKALTSEISTSRSRVGETIAEIDIVDVSDERSSETE